MTPIAQVSLSNIPDHTNSSPLLPDSGHFPDFFSGISGNLEMSQNSAFPGLQKFPKSGNPVHGILIPTECNRRKASEQQRHKNITSLSVCRRKLNGMCQKHVSTTPRLTTGKELITVTRTESTSYTMQTKQYDKQKSLLYTTQSTMPQWKWLPDQHTETGST